MGMKNYVGIFRWLVLVCTLSPDVSLYSQMQNLTFQGLERTFLVHLPPGYDDSATYPLVIAMHGGFGSAMNLQNQSQLSLKADQEGFIVVYPEGVQGGILNIRTWNGGRVLWSSC